MKNLIALIQIKKLIALMLSIVFCILALKGKVSPEQFITVFMAVVSFYFGQSSVRQAMSEGK